jgi:hypothetical protein
MTKLLLREFSQISSYSLLDPNILSSTEFFETVNRYYSTRQKHYVARPQSKFPTRPKLANLIFREANAHFSASGTHFC